MDLKLDTSCRTVAAQSNSSGYSTKQNTPDSSKTRPRKPLDEDHKICRCMSLCIVKAEDFFIQTDCTFYIQLKKTTPSFDLCDLKFIVLGPSGFSYPVMKVNLIADRISCTFRPLEIGFFTINVFYKNFIHIGGSPSSAVVSKDYMKKLTRAIVTFDVELLNRPDQVTPVVDVDEPPEEVFRRWTLCCNTRTEQLFIADYVKHEILVFQPDGDFSFAFGGFGSGPGQFRRPASLAYDAVGDRIFVADKGNHRIQIFNSNGDFQSSFGEEGTTDGQFNLPWAVAVSRDGSLIAVASDSKNRMIQLFDVNGKYLRKYHFMSIVKSTGPPGLGFDLNGEFLYVTDFYTHVVFQLDISFCECRRFINSKMLKRPSSLTVEPETGNIIVSDLKNNALKVFKPNGKALAKVFSIATTNLVEPLDVTAMKGGFLAVLDLNGRVRIF